MSTTKRLYVAEQQQKCIIKYGEASPNERLSMADQWSNTGRPKKIPVSSHEFEFIFIIVFFCLFVHEGLRKCMFHHRNIVLKVLLMGS